MMQISWTQGYSLSRKPAKKKRPRKTLKLPSQGPDGSQNYEFISEYVMPSRSRGAISADSETSSRQNTGDDNESRAIVLQRSIPPTILFDTLLERYKPVLDQYDEQFCQIPITLKLEMNPFRCSFKPDANTTFLLHAIMALAGHHTGSATTRYHQHEAVHLLRQSLSSTDVIRRGPATLDTIVILSSVDQTQSALGTWRMHSAGAYSLLEACGGIPIWTKFPRAQVQVAMLMWWDAHTSMLAREPCVLPYTYFEAISSSDQAKQWDYYSLVGCPLALVDVIMQLARLSPEAASARSEGPAKSKVQKLKQMLESWQHVSSTASIVDEESMLQDQDARHCEEAWRNGLLLYLHRVFEWQPGEQIPKHFISRAKVIMAHASACRDEGMVARQALLPLFLAACEFQERSLRMRIMKSCAAWNDETGYGMFSDAIPLLEEVWAEQEAKGFKNVWWGQIVDRRHGAHSNNPLQMRLCFG